MSAWAKERATRGRDHSADPEAKTETGSGRATELTAAAFAYCQPELRDWHSGVKSLGGFVAR